MHRLTAEDVEAAFVETAREQQNGEPFRWSRAAELLNGRLGNRRLAASAERPLMLQDRQ